MVLSDIADNSIVFVDANIFIYHFAGPSQFSDSCSDFLARIEDGEIIGYTSTTVVMEVLHRLMIIEGSKMFNIQPGKVLSYLKKKPDEISSLTNHLKIVGSISQFNLNMLTTTIEDINSSQTIKRDFYSVKEYCVCNKKKGPISYTD